MVPPSSNRISRVPPYSSSPTASPFRLRGFHPVSLAFPNYSAKNNVVLCDWASPLSLAATHGISIDVFSSGYWDVSVPRVRFLHLSIQCKITPKGWVSPFRYHRISARLPAPRCFSQATTSFFAFYCLGILHMRFVTWPYKHETCCLFRSLKKLASNTPSSHP